MRRPSLHGLPLRVLHKPRQTNGRTQMQHQRLACRQGQWRVRLKQEDDVAIRGQPHSPAVLAAVFLQSDYRRAPGRHDDFGEPDGVPSTPGMSVVSPTPCTSIHARWGGSACGVVFFGRIVTSPSWLGEDQQDGPCGAAWS